MAANRLDAAKTGDEARAAEPTGASAVPPGGGWSAWLPLLVSLVAMPLLAYGMTVYVLLPRLQQGLNSPAPGASAPEKTSAGPTATGGTPDVVALNKLLVNVAGTMGARYLLTSIALAGNDPELKTKILQHEAQLRDTACGTLATKTLADIEKPGARNLIRSELISSFNSILGGPVVQELYFTEFAVQ